MVIGGGNKIVDDVIIEVFEEVVSWEILLNEGEDDRWFFRGGWSEVWIFVIIGLGMEVFWVIFWWDGRGVLFFFGVGIGFGLK